MLSAAARARRVRRRRASGQSLVEFALLVPVLLLILLIAIDFGRVYLGWVNLQQMVRIAANYAAEHASAWGTPQDAEVLAAYQSLVENDTSAINCEPQRNDSGDLPGPQFVDGTFALGARVQVDISCKFTIATPVINGIIGNADGGLILSSSIVYPIREGAVAEVPGGGAPVVVPPIAGFTASPRSGYGPLTVVFTDASDNGPTSWSWDFGNGTAFTRGPHTVVYECDPSVLPGDSCTFEVSLAVQNEGGSDRLTRADYIEVLVPPDTGPIADFVGTPLTGTAPLAVDFDFVDARSGSVVYTNYRWDFDTDGTWDVSDAGATQASHTYADPGEYDVTLEVTDDAGATHSVTKVAYITAARRLCTVPDFAGVKVSRAQGVWAAANFTTTVTTLPPPARGASDYRINYQSLLGGTPDPQPDGCDSTITVGP